MKTLALSLVVGATLTAGVATTVEAASLGAVGEYDDGTTKWTTQQVLTEDDAILEFLSLEATLGLGFGVVPAGYKSDWSFANAAAVQTLWDAFGLQGMMGDEIYVNESISVPTAEAWLASLGVTRVGNFGGLISRGFYAGDCGAGVLCLAGVDFNPTVMGAKQSDNRAAPGALEGAAGNFLIRKSGPTETVPEPITVWGMAVALCFAIGRRKSA